jgi:hydrogenase expression/formation protein HypE
MSRVYEGATCAVPVTSNDRITLAHGDGGRAMRKLIRERVVAKFENANDYPSGDAADLGVMSDRMAVTTDSYVVSPLFFPGGDIGSLAVHGTVNDLAMAGATPLYLTLALIIEEGFPFADFDRIIDSVAKSAMECGVKVVTGDTKVVPKGAADGIFINTTGFGTLQHPYVDGAKHLAANDCLIFSGPIGQHGIAVLAARESLKFMPPPQTDSAPLHHVTLALRRELNAHLHAMRDATRGGVAAVLHEWAEESGKAMWLDEAKIPLTPATRGICETLGLDPLFLANEGTFVTAVAEHRCADAINVLRRFPVSQHAAMVGRVIPRGVSPVVVHRGIGVDQPLDESLHAMLPRIC